MRAQIVGMVLVGMFALPACDGDAGPTAEEFVDAVGASQQVLHYTTFGQIPSAHIEVTVDAGGSSVIRFTNGSVTGADWAHVESLLMEVRLEGALDSQLMTPYLEALGSTDLGQFARRLGDMECPEVIDDVPNIYRFTNQSTSLTMHPCGSWGLEDYPVLFREAQRVARAAIEDQEPLVSAWANLGEGLDRFGHQIAEGASLVAGGIVTIDRADELGFTIQVVEALIGEVTSRDLRHAIDAARIHPGERAVVDDLDIGDRVIALVDSVGKVTMVGFLDEEGAVIDTGVSTSSLSLGWAAHLAARLETYANLGVDCPASAFLRETPTEALGPLGALIEHGERIAAAEARRIAQRKHQRRADRASFTATFSRIPDSGYLVITGPAGRFLGQIPLDGRRQRSRAIELPPEGRPAVVWILAEEERGACAPFEFGALALARGERVFEIPYDELTAGDITIDVAGRTYRVES